MRYVWQEVPPKKKQLPANEPFLQPAMFSQLVTEPQLPALGFFSWIYMSHKEKALAPLRNALRPMVLRVFVWGIVLVLGIIFGGGGRLAWWTTTALDLPALQGRGRGEARQPLLPM